MVRTFLRSIVQSCVVFTFLSLLTSSSASGQGSNPFFPPPTFSGNGQALSADVNGDGKPDLLFFDGTVLLGKGDGIHDRYGLEIHVRRAKHTGNPVRNRGL